MKNLTLTFLACVCLLVSPTVSKGQYVISPVAPPPNFTFNDLWHFTLSKAGADSYNQFYVSLRIFDNGNMLKVKSNTATIQLPTGSAYYNLTNLTSLQPFVTSYYDASLLQNTISSGGQFPPGVYHFVYTLFGKTADGEFTPLFENVSEAVVDVMWPPMLLSPPDEDTIYTPYPLLTWTPAFNSSYAGQITYTLNMVELFPGQNSYQAIQSNPSYFTQNNIPITMLPYPPGAQMLDTSKVYAWQVHADAQGVSLGVSEVWTFAFPKNRYTSQKETNNVYFDIVRQLPSEFYKITDGFLYFKYEEEYFIDNNATLRYSILDKYLVPVSGSVYTLPTIRGINRYKISQCDLNLPHTNKETYYYLKINNPKGETFTIKFFPLTDFRCNN